MEGLIAGGTGYIYDIDLFIGGWGCVQPRNRFVSLRVSGRGEAAWGLVCLSSVGLKIEYVLLGHAVAPFVPASV